MFASLTAIGSLVKIPIPGTALIFTFQTLFVFMSGLILKPKYALISQAVYMAIGLIGLPVFSTGGGLAYLLSPTFGFIIGFCACAWMMSIFVRKPLLNLIHHNESDKRVITIIKIGLFSLISIIVMYVFGIAHMYIIFNMYLGQNVSLYTVIFVQTGIFVFIDIAKFAIALPLCSAILKRMNKEWLK